MQLLTSMIMKNNVINNGINYVINNVIILKVNLVDKSDWRRSGFIKLKECQDAKPGTGNPETDTSYPRLVYNSSLF